MSEKRSAPSSSNGLGKKRKVTFQDKTQLPPRPSRGVEESKEEKVDDARNGGRAYHEGEDLNEGEWEE